MKITTYEVETESHQDKTSSGEAFVAGAAFAVLLMVSFRSRRWRRSFADWIARS